MEIKYTYKQDGKFLIGRLNEYPEYPTQAFNIDELEANLKDIYCMINDGTLKAYNKQGNFFFPGASVPSREIFPIKLPNNYQ